MEDLISRQAALDIINAGLNGWLTDDERLHLEGVAIGIELLPAERVPQVTAESDLSGYSDRLWKAAYERGKADAQKTAQWIPVTERLPEDAGTYIITDHYGNVMSRHFCKKVGTFSGYWHANGSKFYGNPVAWMPLPEPYKEAHNEED